MKESKQKCGIINASRSLVDWLGILNAEMGFERLIDYIGCIFKNELIDRSDNNPVHIDEAEAYCAIAQMLIMSTDKPVDEIALTLFEIGRPELLYALTDYIVSRNKQEELVLMRIFYISQASGLHPEMRSYYAFKLAECINGIDKLTDLNTGVKAKVDDIWE